LLIVRLRIVDLLLICDCRAVQSSVGKKLSIHNKSPFDKSTFDNQSLNLQSLNHQFDD